MYKCGKYKKLINEYVTDKILISEGTDAGMHILSCSDCATYYEEITLLTDALDLSDLKYDINIKNRVLYQIDNQATETRKKTGPVFRYATALTAFVLMAGIFFVTYKYGLNKSDNNIVPEAAGFYETSDADDFDSFTYTQRKVVEDVPAPQCASHTSTAECGSAEIFLTNMSMEKIEPVLVELDKYHVINNLSNDYEAGVIYFFTSSGNRKIVVERLELEKTGETVFGSSEDHNRNIQIEDDSIFYIIYYRSSN